MGVIQKKGCESKMSVHLTNADLAAVAASDHEYLNQKGAKYYAAQDYGTAIEYYRLAAAMGNTDSVSNLGYCYMYGRSIPKNMSLAMAYFRAAAGRGCIDALYKLGSIYKYGADGIAPDAELSLYYYLQAKAAIDHAYVPREDYPSLCYSLAQEMMPGGQMMGDLRSAYHYLQDARLGFELELENGITYHQNTLTAVLQLLEQPCFSQFADELEDD